MGAAEQLISASSTRPLRVLFVSSTTTGGSGRSQRELNESLRSAGVDTLMLVDNAVGATVTRFLHEQLWDASVRFAQTPVLGGSASWLRSIPGRTPQRQKAVNGGGDVLVTPAPENAFPDLAISFKPDIVIGSSIALPTWRVIRSACDELAIPSTIYLREQTALRHLEPSTGGHASVMANSVSLVDDAFDMYGVDAGFVPSVVDVSTASVRSTRERVLLVNPRFEHGVDIVDDLASAFRTVEFVLQESWTLTASEKRYVDELLERHPNVIFRPRTDSPAEIYRDAAVLLAPHKMDNRPRVILEAMSNGIPVIANDLPGLVESVGPGGIIASRPSEWVDAIHTLLQDQVAYRKCEKAARAFASRPEVQVDQVVDTFLKEIRLAINGYAPKLVP